MHSEGHYSKFFSIDTLHEKNLQETRKRTEQRFSAKSYYNSTKNNRIRTHYFHQVLTLAITRRDTFSSYVF